MEHMFVCSGLVRLDPDTCRSEAVFGSSSYRLVGPHPCQSGTFR